MNSPDPSSASVPQDPRSIGHYMLGATIGEGTFGKVRLATHILTGEKVAVKVLEKSRISDTSDIDRVTREVHILKIIRHPNTIQLYEIIEDSAHLYLITEYASGGELFDYIVSNVRINEPEACVFFQQIISGIEYLHKIGVVHRDLKPENLLLDFDKNVKIVDFGLSNLYRTGEKLKTACGSPCYAAPEMIAGKKYVGIQVDIWSAGIVLYALACGYLPFEDPNTSSLYAKILKGTYALPGFLSADVKDLIKGILNVDPAKRFTMEDIKRHVWYNLVPCKDSPGIIVGLHQIPVDLGIVQQLSKLGFGSEFAMRCVQANKHNHATATYYLLLAKKVREGGYSNADLCVATAELLRNKSKSKPKTKMAIKAAESEGNPSCRTYSKEKPDKDLNKLKLSINEDIVRIISRDPNNCDNPRAKRNVVSELNSPQGLRPSIDFERGKRKGRLERLNATIMDPKLSSPLPYIMKPKLASQHRREPLIPSTTGGNSSLNSSLIVESRTTSEGSRGNRGNVQQITMIKPRIDHVTIIAAPPQTKMLPTGHAIIRSGRKNTTRPPSIDQHNIAIRDVISAMGAYKNTCSPPSPKIRAGAELKCNNRRRLNQSVDIGKPSGFTEKRLIAIYNPRRKVILRGCKC